MKRLIQSTVFVTAMILVTAGPGHAQRAKTLVGAIGGATTSDICCTINTASRWGGTAGLFAAFRASRQTVVSLEALWTQKGGDPVRMYLREIGQVDLLTVDDERRLAAGERAVPVLAPPSKRLDLGPHLLVAEVGDRGRHLAGQQGIFHDAHDAHDPRQIIDAKRDLEVAGHGHDDC